MSRLIRTLWRTLPQDARVTIKGAVYRSAPFLFSRTAGYQLWEASERRRREIPAQPGVNSWFVLTTIHSEFIAECICHELRALGHEAYSGLTLDDRIAYARYIVVAPHAHPRLPPRYIAYQVEQLSTSRYLTNEYINQLRSADAVLEYSSTNLPVLAGIGVDPGKIFLLKLDKLLSLEKGLVREGAIFLGDPGGVRRPALLTELRAASPVEVLVGVYGDAADTRFGSAKVVVNLHYYPDANLESERIFRSLSFGTPLVSESAPDLHDYKDLGEAVCFVEKGDMQALATATNRLLNDEAAYSRAQQAIERLRLATPSFSVQFKHFVQTYESAWKRQSEGSEPTPST